MPDLRPIYCLQSPAKYRGLASSFSRGFNLTIDTIMTPFFAQNCRRMLLAVLVAPLVTMAQPAANLPPLPEDLIPALRPLLVSALAQSPQMIAQNISIASAEAVLIQNRAGMLPSLSGSANYGRSDTVLASQSSISSSSSGLFYNLGVSQPVFQWNALKYRTDSGKVGVKIAEHQYAEAYRLLVVSLRSQFLALVVKKIALRNAEYSLKQAEETLALAEANLKAGRISPEAMMDPRLAVDEARLARDRAVEDLDNSQRLLLLTVGHANFDVNAVPDEVPQPTYAPDVVAQLLQGFVQNDADQTFTAATYRGYIKQADLDYRIARVNLLPKFSFSANATHQSETNAGPNYVYSVVVNSTTWGVYGNWSIFDGFATRGAKLSALHRKRSYERTLRTLTDQTIAQARDLEKQLGFAWRAAQISQTRHDVSVAAVKRLEDDLQSGKAARTAVSAAQLNAYYLDLYLASARSEFFTDWSQFVSTVCIDPMLNLVPASYLQDGK
jgi:outer membrane protein TolC